MVEIINQQESRLLWIYQASDKIVRLLSIYQVELIGKTVQKDWKRQ